MNKVVSLTVVRAERQITAEEAWERFVAAKKLSEASGKIEDGLAAGHAYRAFLELFVRRAS